MKHRKRQLAAIFTAFALLLGGCSAHTPTSSSTAQATEGVPTSSTQEEQTVIINENSILTNGGTRVELSSLEHYKANSGSTVYYSSEITADAMVQLYNALGWTPTGKVAVKLSTGEPPASNYLDPELIKGVVQAVNGTIVECNTAYGGSRASTAAHLQVAEDHGFTAIADVDIMDAEGSMSLPVTGGTRLTENFVGTHFSDYGSFVVLSHFKGHAMAGFGGAIKNISIGIASSEGKAHIHSGGTGGSMWSADQNSFLESMAEAGKSVSDSLESGANIVYISVMNRISIDCDCDGHPAEGSNGTIFTVELCPAKSESASLNARWQHSGADGKFVDLGENAEALGLYENTSESDNGHCIYSLRAEELKAEAAGRYQLVLTMEDGTELVSDIVTLTVTPYAPSGTPQDDTEPTDNADSTVNT